MDTLDLSATHLSSENEIDNAIYAVLCAAFAEEDDAPLRALVRLRLPDQPAPQQIVDAVCDELRWRGRLRFEEQRPLHATHVLAAFFDLPRSERQDLVVDGRGVARAGARAQVLPGLGASMRWVGWFLVLGAVACGGGHAGLGDPDAGAGGTAGVTPPPAFDGGVPDAGPSADCAGVMPAPAGFAYTFDVATNTPGDACDLATTDGQGVVAAKGGATQWSEFSDVGTRNGSFQAADPQVLPQTSGFVGLSGSGTLAVERWDASGGNLGFAVGGPAGMVALAPAQGDGAIIFSADSTGLKIRRLDPTLAEAQSLTVSGTFTPRGGAQDASGAVLALVGAGSAVSGIWVDLAKGTAGAPFSLGSATRVLARPLLGGGVAVRLDGHWSALLQPGDSTLHAAPSWLRDGTDIATVRAGKAYALVPSAGSSVDLVSPQGNLCGSMPFSGVTSVSVGADGSVVGSSGPSGCTKVFWRNALR